MVDTGSWIPVRIVDYISHRFLSFLPLDFELAKWELQIPRKSDIFIIYLLALRQIAMFDFFFVITTPDWIHPEVDECV
jgi:hypothetical protein